MATVIDNTDLQGAVISIENLLMDLPFDVAVAKKEYFREGWMMWKLRRKLKRCNGSWLSLINIPYQDKEYLR